MRARTPSTTGFTLVELVIAVGVTGILIAAAMSLMVSQQNAFRAGSEDRGLQETGRVALTAITEKLRFAGYGIEPGYTLDFGQTDPVPQPGLTAGAQSGALSTYRCPTAIDCRDRVRGPDEIVFYARDPLFSRRVVAASVTQSKLEFEGRVEQPLRPGQILQVMCLAGSRARAYVTVQTLVPAATNVPQSDTTKVLVALADGVEINTHSAFPFQNAQLADTCFQGDAVVAKVDRFRFHIMGFTEQGVAVDPAAGGNLQATGVRPYLMLDQGLTDNGVLIDLPVAPDVEDLQFTYLYPPAVAGGALREVGGTENVLASADAFPMQLVTPPKITDALTAATRGTGSPVNIQAVRVSLVIRTAAPDLKYSNAEDRRIPPTPVSGRAAGVNDPLANRPSYQGVPMFRRLRIDTTLLMPNLKNGAVVYCVVDPTGTIPGANFGGC